ncbi:ribonuclease VapC [Spirochaetia bacterium]|nr:ribonuclease VapC [Spirochaetia bacterium]
MIIVDSSVWIDFFNPKIVTKETELLKQFILLGYPIYLCPVIFQEVLQGIKDDKTFSEVKYFLSNVRMIDIDIMEATNHAVNLYRQLRKKGKTIRKSVDCLIASYALLNDMYILHNDRDFIEIASGSELKVLKI